MKALRLICLFTVLLVGCDSVDGTGPAGGGSIIVPGSLSVSQGGAQDIARFRSLVGQGEIPSPSVLDPVGFFAEHAVDLPAADCDDAVCLHPMLAVAPRFDGDNWTMAFVGMNTPVDPSSLEREPVHFIVALESGLSVGRQALGRVSLEALSEELREGDRVTVLRYGRATQEVLAEDLDIDDPEAQWFSLGGGEDAISLYDGLAAAGRIATNVEGNARILLVTSGRANSGITDVERIGQLADGLATLQIPISVVGSGDDFLSDAPIRISEGGGGAFYFAESYADLETIFSLEGRTALTPLATDFQLSVEAAPGYRIGRIYGARRASTIDSAAHLSSPLLTIGNRTGSDDVDEGRRGGGGGLFVELLHDADSDVGADQPAFTVRASWRDGQTGELVETEQTVVNELAPGRNPGGMFPYFTDPARGKAFMMLNMYLALRLMTTLYQQGDCASALGVETMMMPSYAAWQTRHDDPDIEDDWDLLLELDEVIDMACTPARPAPDQRQEREPESSSLACFFI